MTQQTEATTSPPDQPVQEPSPPPAPEGETTPDANPFKKWRVVLRQGGVVTEMVSGTQQECIDAYALEAAKIKLGNLLLLQPDSPVPVAQVSKPGYLPHVRVPETGPEGGPLPPLIIEQPDMKKINEFFGMDNAPVEEPIIDGKPRKVERITWDTIAKAAAERAAAPAAVPAARTPAPAARAPVPALPDQPGLYTDLAIVDESLRDLELVALVLTAHRRALISKISESQSAQTIITRAQESLLRLR